MNSQDFNTRITIEKPAAGRDAAGQPVVGGWVEVAKAWASILNKNGLQTIKSDAPTSVVQASVRIHWRSDITEAMRVRIGSTVYQVQAVLPDWVHRRHVDLVCETVAGRV